MKGPVECMLIEQSEMGSGNGSGCKRWKHGGGTERGGICFAPPTEATSGYAAAYEWKLLHAAGIDAHAALYTGNAWLKRLMIMMPIAPMWACRLLKFLRLYACGTIEQLMTCIKKVKHGMVNLSGIADKAMGHRWISRLWCLHAAHYHGPLASRALRTPVIILSATAKQNQMETFDVYHCAEEIENGYPLLSV